MCNKVTEAVAEPVGVPLGQIDLPLHTVQREADRLNCCRAVDVVLEGGQNPCRHGGSFFPSGLDMKIRTSIPTNKSKMTLQRDQQTCPFTGRSVSNVVHTPEQDPEFENYALRC